LIKTTGIIFLATLIGNLINFLSNFYLSTKLGPESFGIYKTVIYFFVFLPALANLGIQSVFPKYISEFKASGKEKIGHLVVWFMKWRLILFLILGILIFLFRYQLSLYLFHDVNHTSLIAAGLFIYASLFFAVLPYAVQGYQNFNLFSLTLFFSYAIPPVISIALIPFGINYMLVGFGLATAASYLITLRFLFRQHAFSDKIHFSMKKIIWPFSMPMHVLYLIMALPSLAVPIFSIFFDQVVIGQFSYSIMFYTAAMLIPGIISFVVLPKSSELNALKKFKSSKDLLKKAFLLYTPVAVVSSILVVSLSKIFLSMVSPVYLPSLPLFNSLIVLGLFSGYGIIYSAYLQGKGNVKKTAMIILILNILLFLVSAVFLNYIKL
jgi:O-antigen/teichoic acid export membrane protein